jgi:hypothetical protein
MTRTTTTHRAPPRYTHISIPGDEDRGVETAWYKARQLNRALQVGPNGC